MFTELKDSFSKEFQELKDELKQFRRDTEWDIRTIMEQTTDLRQKKRHKRTDYAGRVEQDRSDL